MDLFRAPPPPTSATSPSLSTFEPVSGPPAPIAPKRVCAVCGGPLRAGARKEARSCSGKCRIIACRQRRHSHLLNRLAVAEAALSAAAEAVAALRPIAAQGPHVTASLAVSGGGK